MPDAKSPEFRRRALDLVSPGNPVNRDCPGKRVRLPPPSTPLTRSSSFAAAISSRLQTQGLTGARPTHTGGTETARNRPVPPEWPISRLGMRGGREQSTLMV